jgi:CRISPR/Cas system CSM-associated protein Csm2 small subunit
VKSEIKVISVTKIRRLYDSIQEEPERGEMWKECTFRM